MKNGTAKVVCNCKHDFQDAQYGANTRVANATKKQDATSVEVRCTVCSRIHKVSPSKVK